MPHHRAPEPDNSSGTLLVRAEFGVRAGWAVEGDCGRLGVFGIVNPVGAPARPAKPAEAATLGADDDTNFLPNQLAPDPSPHRSEIGRP
jgi:hypothetical protein